MVLWEITVATAYFLGLKRTYKLALKLQRRVLSRRHPKLRGFLHRRTRAAFDIALTVHRKIQEKDIEVGRTLGNRILRWLEPMNPSAEMQCSPVRPAAGSLLRQIGSSVRASMSQRPNANKFMDRGFRHHLFATSWNRRPTSFPAISMTMQPVRPVGMGCHCWHLNNFAASRFGGVFRKDIMQWMHRVNPV